MRELPNDVAGEPPGNQADAGAETTSALPVPVEPAATEPPEIWLYDMRLLPGAEQARRFAYQSLGRIDEEIIAAKIILMSLIQDWAKWKRDHPDEESDDWSKLPVTNTVEEVGSESNDGKVREFKHRKLYRTRRRYHHEIQRYMHLIGELEQNKAQIAKLAGGDDLVSEQVRKLRAAAAAMDEATGAALLGTDSGEPESRHEDPEQ